MKKNIIFIAILFLFLGSGCEKRKDKEYMMKNRTSKFLLKKLKKNQIEANLFSAKATFFYDDGNFSVSATGNIRMKKDSVFWINIKKFGFEVGRAIMTKDSIFFLNRITKEFLAKDIAFFKNKFDIPISFDDLQNIILGNPLYLVENYKSDIKGNTYRLFGQNSTYLEEYRLDGLSYFIKEMSIKEKSGDRDINLSFDKYKILPNGQNFSYFRSLKFYSMELGDINIEFDVSKVQFDNRVKIPFEIPDNYVKMNW